jgi:hypothetical protein
MGSYARVKLPHLWIIDPLARTLEIFRLAERGWFLVSTHAGDERVRAEPFEAVELDMARWWVESTAAP